MLKTESSCSAGLLCVVIESKRERVAPDGVESVPGAIATGSVNVTIDRYVSCDPVATAPGTDLIEFANSRMAPQKSSVSKKKFVEEKVQGNHVCGRAEEHRQVDP